MLKFMCLSALALCVISHPLGPEKTGHVEEVSKYHSTELNHPKFNRPSPINPDIPSDPKPSDDVKISVLSEDEKHKLSENKPVSPSSFHEHEQSDSYGARIAPTTEAPKHKRSPDHIEGHDEKHPDSHHDSHEHEHEHKVDDHKKGYFPEYNSQPQVKLASEHDDDHHVDHDHHDDHHNDHDHHEHHDHDNNHHKRHTEDVKANPDKPTLRGSAPAVNIEKHQPVEAVPVHENKARITREEAKPSFASGPQINVKPPSQGPSSNQKPQINVKPPTQRSKRESEKSTVTTSAAPVTENTKSEVKSVSNTAAKTTAGEPKTEVASGTQINVKPLPSESETETETEPPCDLGPEDDDEPSTQSSGATSAPVSGNAKTEAKSESSTAKATEEESKPKVTSDTQTDDEASPDCDLEPEKKDEPSPKRTKRAYGDCPCRSKTKSKKTYPRKRVQPQYNLLPLVPRRKRDTTSSSGDKIAPVVTVSSFSQTWTREPQNPPAVEAAHHETTSTTTERHRRRRGVDETESQDEPTTAKPTRAWWRSIDPDRVKSEPAPSTAPPSVKAHETVKAHEVTTDKNEKHKRDTKDEKDSETTSTTVKYNRPSEPAEPVYDSKPPTFVHPVPVAQILGSHSDQHAQTHHEDKASAESASSSEEGKSVENKPKHATKEAEEKAN